MTSHAVQAQAEKDLGYAELQLESHRKKLTEAEKELELAHKRVTHWEQAVDRRVRMLKAVLVAIEEERNA